MAVSNTYTLEHSFGSRIVVTGAGFLLNNEMIDFNWFPGVTTRDGTSARRPNQIAPGKRMLSSQTPTIVARDGKVVLVTGSPGSRTIINTSLSVVLNVIEFDMDAAAAVDCAAAAPPVVPRRGALRGITRVPGGRGAAASRWATSSTGTRQGDAHTIWVDPKTGSTSAPRIGASAARRRGSESAGSACQDEAVSATLRPARK